MNVASTALVDGVLYVSVPELVEHLTVCAESVRAFCSEGAPGASYVVQTLEQTVSTLRDLT